MTDLPPDVSVEPTREVLRRLYVCGGAMSLRADESVQRESLIERADELAVQGWLERGESYPHFGATYTRFKTGARLNFKALRDL